MARINFIFCLISLSLGAPSRAVSKISYRVSRPINISGAHDMTISGREITGGALPAIKLSNCYNIRITRNRLSNSTAAGIYLINCRNIIIDYNYISNVSSGVYAENSEGGIIVSYNRFKNMRGPMPRGQFVQFNNVNGAGNSISFNKGENVLGQSNPEDGINLFKSNGVPYSPIKVTGNWIRGGGPSRSGGGIMLGDNGGSYQVAFKNILINPGQYGMAIAGGDHISIIENTIYGKAQDFTNVGIYILGQAGYHCSNATITGNKVRFMNAKNIENDRWLGMGEAVPAGWGANYWGANIGESVLPRTIVP
jgi:parallel beta-helix repeat protein